MKSISPDRHMKFFGDFFAILNVSCTKIFSKYNCKSKKVIPLPVNAIFFFCKNSKWRPKILSEYTIVQ